MDSPHFPLDFYSHQKLRWPITGRHILAHYDDTSLIVYQAYKPSIAGPAVQYQNFLTSNPEFNPRRMTWFKPNFLWMMYRSGWATKPDQQITLAISLSRPWFEEILSTNAELSTKTSSKNDRDDPSTKPEVIVQWDPDHDPLGRNESRRAIQIGIRGSVAEEFARGTQGRAITSIRDISEFVARTKSEIIDGGWVKIESDLRIPIERQYPVDENIRKRLGMIL